MPLGTVVLASRRGQLSLATGVLAFVVAVIAAAMVGGLVPAALPAGRGPWQPPARPRGCLAPVPVLARRAVIAAGAGVGAWLAGHGLRYDRLPGG